MLGFFGIRKESSKKPVSEKESDGFVIVGETVEEQKQKTQSKNTVPEGVKVFVEPSWKSSTAPAPPVDSAQLAPVTNQSVESPPMMPELLGDVPFTLAPHLLALQTGFADLPDALLSRDFNDNLASFRYDFTLENSVLCDS
ncbi:UBAP1-MVB12-associated (UMA)-domain containing protein 1 isoform X2 [Lepisosteus oculatus]|nr:PREDICTED: UBAP1-MVB12-associated (UMA)-domain containing protein 1 isoform X2 [Lepisosteus oculatus]XP_015213374.1 PREDICTED: UBAP1-MVB12-associated (UMA)-domain containing protein 1 isoform X2 [Lepisosteus oculatus]XP_015213376.1 PREDICTED: UBAP1-MVB12-associated (UMA)-domain containing protein 1 isoform X2 [Lepisosteus oculatus]XP_015213377.1 PREDICTED: UBAP1-MVB12-associated (UMA)-domain containing protein 1 isoform X2 [Lepisosteus oculatus]